MEITPTTIFLVGVISVILGFLASSLLNTLRDDGAEPVQGEDPTPPGGRKGRYTPIFRLWRERDKGTLVVEIGGKSLVDRSALDDAQREQIEDAARDLRSWLGMGLSQQHSTSQPVDAVASAWSSDTAEPDPEAIPLPGPTTALQSSGEDANLRQESGQGNKSRPKQPAAASGRQAAPAAGSKPASAKQVENPKDAPPGPKSIVMQIEDILQDMIAGTPLERREIHLSEDPARGVIVSVGVDHFEGIEAVPDPTVKAVIRQAVAEWEQSQ